MTWAVRPATLEEHQQLGSLFVVTGEQPRHTRVRKLLVNELLDSDGRRMAEHSDFGPNWRYGYDLIQESGVGAGSMYPFLHELERAGALISQIDVVRSVENVAAKFRRMYHLTPEGVVWARAWMTGASLPVVVAHESEDGEQASSN